MNKINAAAAQFRKYEAEHRTKADRFTEQGEREQAEVSLHKAEVNREQAEVLEKLSLDLDNVHAISMDPGNSHADHYLRGMANGLELALATVEGREPAYVEATVVEPDLGELVTLVGRWAGDRNLIEGSNPQAQTVKLFEEGGELAGGVARKNLPVIEDSIGDVVVVLVILALQTGLHFETCVRNAYNEIKDRKGRMVDGVFVKDAE